MRFCEYIFHQFSVPFATCFWYDAAIETTSSAISIKSSRHRSVGADIASRKESFDLNPSNELLTLTLFKIQLFL